MISAADITAAVRGLGVRPDDALFVHSDVTRCIHVAGRRPADKLDTIVEGLAATVPAGALLMPTFTYSFCRGEEFEIDASPSTTGALTEHFRRTPGARRTADPIFSAALLGRLGAEWERALLTPGDSDCFGDRSVFGFLRARGAKLLMFGSGFGCCTFACHLEQRVGVPYRYFKNFSGVVRDGDRTWPTTARYYVRDLEADAVNDLSALERALLSRGRAAVEQLPDGPELFLTDAAAVLDVGAEHLRRDPRFLLGAAGGVAA